MEKVQSIQSSSIIKLAVDNVTPKVVSQLGQFSTFTDYGTCIRDELTTLAQNIWSRVVIINKTIDELVFELSHKLEQEAYRFY